jgi:hypothetical protein
LSKRFDVAPRLRQAIYREQEVTGNSSEGVANP